MLSKTQDQTVKVGKRQNIPDCANARPPEKAASAFSADIDPDDDMTLGPEALLAASQKLLAINRGEADPDERDALYNARVYMPDKLFSERILLDATKSIRGAVRRAARQRNLSGISAGQFDDLLEGLIIGNPLSSPIEEINPMHIVEQNRRITRMGPGGIASDDQITEEAQAVHPSTFGFLSPLETPESERAGIDLRLSLGARIGTDGKIYQKFRNRRTGKYQWLSPADLRGKVIGLPQ